MDDPSHTGHPRTRMSGGIRQRRKHESRLRVLHITHELSLTGVPRLTYDTLGALSATMDLMTVSASGGDLQRQFRSFGRVYVLNELPALFRAVSQPAHVQFSKGAGRLRAPIIGVLARSWNPHVVYVNSVAAITLLPRLGLLGRRTVVHVHELGAALERLSAEHRDLLSTVPDRYIAVSRAVVEELVGRGIDSSKVVVIPPMVDLSRIDEMAGAEGAVDREDVDSGTFLVGGAGNPHWTKGIEHWLLMARELVDRVGSSSIRFEWVGVRESHATIEFRAMIRKLGLETIVRLVPETPNPYRHFSRFDVFAMTSWEESASLAVLENMALSVPVVCFSGSGGPPEQLGDTGVVLDTFSPSAMADAVAELLNDPDRRRTIGARERARVASRNAPNRVAPMLAEELARPQTPRTSP